MYDHPAAVQPSVQPAVPAVPTCVCIKVVARRRLQHVSACGVEPKARSLRRRALRLQRSRTLLRRWLGPVGLLGLLLGGRRQRIVLLCSLLLHWLLLPGMLLLRLLPLSLRLLLLPLLLLPLRLSFPPLLLLPGCQRIHILLSLPSRCPCCPCCCAVPKLFGCPPGIGQGSLGRSLRRQPRPRCPSPIIATAIANKAVSGKCEAQWVVWLGV